MKIRYVANRLTRPGNYPNYYWRHLRLREGRDAYNAAFLASGRTFKE